MKESVNVRLVLLREAEQQALDLTYSTLDPVDGFLEIHAARDTACSRLNVSLRGIQETTLMRETTSRNGQTKLRSAIEFLKLSFDCSATELAQEEVLRAGKSYRVPFRFMLPEQVAIGFARYWPHEEALKGWHLLLPPSTNDVVSGHAHNFAGLGQDDLGQVHYSIVATVFGPPASDGPVVAVGKCERRIQVRPRPWQINLLDNAPFADNTCFLDHKSECHGAFVTGIMRKRIGELRIQPSPPDLGYQAVGNAVVVMEVDLLPPKFDSVKGELVQTALYLSTAMRMPDLKTGARSTERIPVRIAKTEASEWALDTAATDGSANLRCSNTQDGPACGSEEHWQDLTVHCEWSCSRQFAPSFSTALVSRWYTLPLDISYTEISSQVQKKFKSMVPIKLSVTPSRMSVIDAGIANVPRYSTFEPPRDSSEEVPDWDALPAYSAGPAGVTVG
ncbi:hypothetical protein LTR85_008699 [Meristemomyces frigidus]|nr:hypothetical protein LTR85_008699 [Meristemomyces frigidus]